MALICKNITEDVIKSVIEGTGAIPINSAHSTMVKISSTEITGVTPYIDDEHTVSHTITKGVSDTTLSVVDLGTDDIITIDVTGYTSLTFSFNNPPSGQDFVYLITEDR